jgi:hypothetical protein
MVRWTCPYCGKSMHSAWDKRTDEVVVCISCDGTFKNPYFRKEGRRADESNSKLRRQECGRSTGGETMIDTPGGPGRFLEYDSNTGLVMVEMDSMYCVVYPADECFVKEA